MVNARKHMGLGGFIALRDVEGGPVEVVITGAAIEDTQFSENAIVLDLDSGQRLVLNADRCLTLCRMHGDDTEVWVGRRIRLYHGSVKGKDAVRIDHPGGATASVSDVAAANLMLRDAADVDDEIPF